MGLDNKCFIELSTSKLTQEEIDAIEEKCNECIRNHIPMTPRWLDPDSKELEQVLLAIRYYTSVFYCLDTF